MVNQIQRETIVYLVQNDLIYYCTNNILSIKPNEKIIGQKNVTITEGDLG